MLLRRFAYHEFTGQPNHWAIADFTLGKINLLVGKNATGKTNTLTRIWWLGSMLAGLQPQLLTSGAYAVEFTDDQDAYHYRLEIAAHQVVSEELTVNGNVMLHRGADGAGSIVTEQFQSLMKFKIPPAQLVAVAKRDEVQHPFLEKVARWADGLRFYPFGSALGKDTFFTANIANNLAHNAANPRDAAAVVALFVKGENDFPTVFKERLLAAMREIGYDLDHVGVIADPALIGAGGAAPATPPAESPILMLYVSEKNSATIPQMQMSQGMFRAFSLLTQIIYNMLKQTPATILIDDIGEGLDFERSTQIVKLLSRMVEQSETQLILTSNDRFVMNGVALKYWQFIQRRGGECRVFNYENSKEKFDDFALTGLANFDFLTTDFINAEWESAPEV
jgi:hypothetical protein